MSKKGQENNAYWDCLKVLSGWILINTILSLMVKPTTATIIFNNPENIKEQFIGNTLVRGLHSYFPSFSIPSYEKEDAFCVLLPPENICKHLTWYLQDFYGHDDIATPAKRICGAYVEKIFNILIDAGANYVDLVWHNSYFYSNVIPLNITTAYSFCSKLGADILCSSERPLPNKTMIDFLMRQADSVHSELIDINLSSLFMKFVMGIIAIGLTLAVINRDKIKDALQRFSIHGNQANNAVAPQASAVPVQPVNLNANNKPS